MIKSTVAPLVSIDVHVKGHGESLVGFYARHTNKGAYAIVQDGGSKDLRDAFGGVYFGIDGKWHAVFQVTGSAIATAISNTASGAFIKAMAAHEDAFIAARS